MPDGKPIELQRTCQECGEKSPASERVCQHCGESFRAARNRREAEAQGEAFGAEKAALNSGVLGGAVALVVAAVWFYIGWRNGYIYFYPPILAVVGVIAIVKGLTEDSGGARRRPAGRGGRRRR